MFEPMMPDPFATKGIEYLLVILFLMLLVPFWRVLQGATGARPVSSSAGTRTGVGWFDLRPGLFYHPGHLWARPGRGGRVRIGLDDFAQKLLGRPQAVRLPEVGARVEQGGFGASLAFDGTSIDLLSPVDGRVVACNPELDGAPERVNEDPYGAGWLLEVEAPRLAPNLRNLLHGGAARDWMAAGERDLRHRVAGGLGSLLQDGGLPVSGIARAISPEDWEELAREFLWNRHGPVSG